MPPAFRKEPYLVELIFFPSFFFQTLLLCVVLPSTEARRLQLTHIPESVADLIDLIKRRFELEEDFSLQFEDPEFGNSLCNLTTMSELPAERVVLHILWQCDASSSNRSSCSSSSAEMISVHSDMFSSSYTDSIQLNMRQVTEWPSLNLGIRSQGLFILSFFFKGGSATMRIYNETSAV